MSIAAVWLFNQHADDSLHFVRPYAAQDRDQRDAFIGGNGTTLIRLILYTFQMGFSGHRKAATDRVLGTDGSDGNGNRCPNASW